MNKPDLDKLAHVDSKDYVWLFNDSPLDDFVAQIVSVGPDAYISKDKNHIIFTEVVIKAHAADVHTWGIIAIPLQIT